MQDKSRIQSYLYLRGLKPRYLERGWKMAAQVFHNERLRALARGASFILYLLAAGLFPGCAQKGDLEKAKEYEHQALSYYARSQEKYKNLIAAGKDTDRAYFELGRLYYAHADFDSAIETLKKTSVPEAKKFIAFAYYKRGDFTDALEIFNLYQMPQDGEYLYYYGLNCEKLNLFDKALEIYRKISAGVFSARAQERINTIEKGASSLNIKDIDADSARIIANAPASEKYPQAGALVLFCDEEIEVTPQGTQVSTLHYIVKIINERGKESFSETHINYDSTYEKVELEYARTIKPDGTVAQVGSRNIRDVSEYLNFPLYSNARVYIISFPEIAEGAVIEYKAKIYRSQLVNKKDFVIAYPLQASEPIIEADFSLRAPQDKKIKIKILNENYNDFGANLLPQREQKDGRLTYRWHFKDMPQIIPEAGMPSMTEAAPVILISTFGSWQDIYQWWWPLAKDKMTADSQIKEKVKDLTAGLASEEAKIRAIYNFCAQKIRYVAVEYGQAGYEPHQASDIFRNKYGDCKDQAILLATMLAEAGIPASPVLIPTKEHYNLNEDFPAIFFDHCIAAVSFGGQTIFLDPTAETCSFADLPVDDQARKVLICKKGGYSIEQTPLYPAAHNSTRESLNIKVDTSGSISAERTVHVRGMYGQMQRYWLVYTTPELIEEQLKQRIQDFSIGATLDKYNIKNLSDLDEPLVLSYSFNGPEYFTVAGQTRIAPQMSSLDTSLVAKEKRRYPLDFIVPQVQEAEVGIILPQDLAVTYLPQDIDEDSPWLKLSIRYQQSGDKIHFEQRLEFKKNTVTLQEYPEFKTFLEKLALKVKQSIVLGKK